MRVIHYDEKQEEVKIQPDYLEDLWFLTKIVEPGDVVGGSSLRRFKTGDKLRPESGEKKKVFIELKVENVEFAEAANKLRLTGVILSGHPEEFVQIGEHHTLDVEPGQRLEIKKKLSSYHWSVIDSAKQSRHPKLLIIVMDEHKATLARLQTQGLSFFANLENKASKREKEHFDEARKEFFNELFTILKNEKDAQIVIAGPGFEKEAFKKYLDQKNFDFSKAWFEHCSNAEESGVHELLKKGVLERALVDQKIAQDYVVLEEFKAHLGKEDGLVEYGVENVRKAVEGGSVERIVVLDELLRGKTSIVSEFIDQARKAGAKLVVFDKETAPGKQFESFKIAAFLRYRVSW